MVGKEIKGWALVLVKIMLSVNLKLNRSFY